MPLHKEAPHKTSTWFKLLFLYIHAHIIIQTKHFIQPLDSEESRNFNLIGQVVSEKKIFEIVDDDEDGRQTTDHGHPISSPCEPSAQVS